MGHEALVKMLLEAGKVKVDLTDRYIYTRVLIAVARGLGAVFKLL